MRSLGDALSSPPSATRPALPAQPRPRRSDAATLKRLLPYLWQYKWRVLAALAFMLGAKLANVGVPLLLKNLVDAMSLKPGQAQALLVVPAALLAGYGLLRFATSLFNELRELIFAKATEGASRRISMEVFRHLHALSLRFHLERQTGGMTRDIERGTQAVQSLISYSLYSIVPTLIELALVLSILALRFDAWFAVITAAALVAYIGFTVTVTEWRTQFRKTMNELGSRAQSRAIDSLLNYETVKYFNNEDFEAARYDEHLTRYRRAAVKSQTTLSLLNAGQQLLIALSLVGMLWRATQGVVEGRMTLGDLVMVNAFMIQLYIPLNFLGMVYREIKQNLVDLDKMFALLEREQEVADAPGAPPLEPADWAVRFEAVHFAYEPSRPILRGLSFEIPQGRTVAVVGPSGAGKSTLARLLYRFYDLARPSASAVAAYGAPSAAAAPAGLGHPGGGGAITIGGQDIRDVTQTSVRAAIGIVPQDTVLFNDTIGYNIAYGRPGATQEEVEAASRAAHIHDFIAALPLGYETTVGERGLKLSGGEKQRVAIARTLLKNPPILIFDEASSALDSANERAIQAELNHAAQDKTVLLIAHRLSTVVKAHEILVMEAGRIVERGTHEALLAHGGRYAQMWALQEMGAVPVG